MLSLHGRPSFRGDADGPRVARPDDRLRIEPGTSRFRVRLFEPPRNDAEWRDGSVAIFGRYRNFHSPNARNPATLSKLRQPDTVP
jgi:hypothetical protein